MGASVKLLNYNGLITHNCDSCTTTDEGTPQLSEENNRYSAEAPVLLTPTSVRARPCRNVPQINMYDISFV